MKKKRRMLRLLAGGLILASSGCCHHCNQWFCDPCADIPPGAIPQPIGTHACSWQTTQAQRAERDDFVVYQYEWIGESTELGPFGTRHLQDATRRMLSEPYSLIVEPSESPELDNERETILRQRLVSAGVPEAESRVQIGYSKAEGLYGQEAPRLDRGYLRGGSFGGGGGGAGGLGAGGTGGSGSYGGGGFF